MVIGDEASSHTVESVVDGIKSIATITEMGEADWGKTMTEEMTILPFLSRVQDWQRAKPHCEYSDQDVLQNRAIGVEAKGVIVEIKFSMVCSIKLPFGKCMASGQQIPDWNTCSPGDPRNIQCLSDLRPHGQW